MKGKPEQLGDGKIVNYGKIPLLKDKKERHSWFEKLRYIKDGTEGKISPYFDRNQVVAYGIELTRLNVNIYDGLPSKEKTALAEEIYQIIDEEARKQNVTDIPVVFGESEYYQPAEEVMEDEGTVKKQLIRRYLKKAMGNSIIRSIVTLNPMRLVTRAEITLFQDLDYWEAWPAFMEDGSSGKSNVGLGLSESLAVNNPSSLGSGSYKLEAFGSEINCIYVRSFSSSSFCGDWYEKSKWEKYYFYFFSNSLNDCGNTHKNFS